MLKPTNMALINCPECNAEVSDKVKQCLNSIQCPNSTYSLIEEVQGAETNNRIIAMKKTWIKILVFILRDFSYRHITNKYIYYC